MVKMGCTRTGVQTHSMHTAAGTTRTGVRRTRCMPLEPPHTRSPPTHQVNGKAAPAAAKAVAALAVRQPHHVPAALGVAVLRGLGHRLPLRKEHSKRGLLGFAQRPAAGAGGEAGRRAARQGGRQRSGAISAESAGSAVRSSGQLQQGRAAGRSLWEALGGRAPEAARYHGLRQGLRQVAHRWYKAQANKRRVPAQVGCCTPHFVNVRTSRRKLGRGRGALPTLTKAGLLSPATHSSAASKHRSCAAWPADRPGTEPGRARARAPWSTRHRGRVGYIQPWQPCCGARCAHLQSPCPDASRSRRAGRRRRSASRP